MKERNINSHLYNNHDHLIKLYQYFHAQKLDVKPGGQTRTTTHKDLLLITYSLLAVRKQHHFQQYHFKDRMKT